MTKQIKIVNNKRILSMEYLRILCMLMVIFGHGLMATGKLYDNEYSTVGIIASCISAFTSVAVNCFFLITGFFGENNKVNIKRIFELWCEMFFYSLVITVVTCIFKYPVRDINVKAELIKSLFPFAFKRYWFIQVYIVLSLLRPVINRGIKDITDKNFLILLCTLIMFFSLHPTFIPVKYTLDQTQGYGIAWGIIMYLSGAWIARHRDIIIIHFTVFRSFVSYVIICVCVFISNLLILRYKIAGGAESRRNFYAYNSITMYVASVSLFFIFVGLNQNIGEKYAKYFLFFSQNVLSAYLITAHPILLIPIWTDVIKINKYENSFILFAYIGFFTLILFVFSILIDKIRIKLFSNHFFETIRTSIFQKIGHLCIFDEQ